MVDSLINPTEKKPSGTAHLDSDPYFFGLVNDEPCTCANIYDDDDDEEGRDTQVTIMESMAKLAKDGMKIDSAILKAFELT